MTIEAVFGAFWAAFSQRWACVRARPLCHAVLGVAAGLAQPAAQAQTLPPAVSAALAQAKLPATALSVWVVNAQGDDPPRLRHRGPAAMNPASLMKLVTTYAALDTLGPAFVWRTPVFVEGTISTGVLHGNVYLQGQGDPKLVLERLWLLLRRLQSLGIQTITGDIVLDGSAFDSPPTNPADFDDEPLRPYNVAPEALLLNFKSVAMTFVPVSGAPVAQVLVEPPLAGVQFPAQVALSPAECADYRSSLQADFSDPTHIRFAGSYPLACGEKTWLQAYADPAHYNQRVILGLWQAMGGRLQGQVRLGRLPQALQGQAPIWELASPPLAEVIRDINKFSNNVMAQQLFLTLGLQAAKRLAPDARTLPPGTPEAARTELYRWWSARLGSDEAPLFENGSGLSRQSRISAQALAHLLQLAYRSPYMAEFMASLPVAGVDGTMQKRPLPSGASAHLKTGSLRDVSALAGYVLANSQRRYVVVAMVNHANAKAARPAFDAFLDWVAQDAHVALKSIPSPPKTKRTRQGLAKPSQHKISRSSF